MSDVSLRDYVDGKVSDLKDRMETLFRAHQTEHTALKEEMSRERKRTDERLAELNRLRQEVIADRGQFIMRSVYDEKHEALTVHAEGIARDAEIRRQQLAEVIEARLKLLEDFRASMVPLLGLVSAGNKWGSTPVGADPGAITPILNQAVNLAFAQVVGAQWYDIFISTAANALGVGRITEAQRAAGGFIISTVGTVTAGGSAPAGSVDLGIVGTGLASNVNPFVVNNAYTPNAAGIVAVGCGGYNRAHLHVKLAVTDLRSLPSLTVTPFYQDELSPTDWFMGTPQTLTFLTAAGQPLEQDVPLTVDGALNLAVLVQAIAGQGAAASIWVELA